MVWNCLYELTVSEVSSTTLPQADKHNFCDKKKSITPFEYFASASEYLLIFFINCRAIQALLEIVDHQATQEAGSVERLLTEVPPAVAFLSTFYFYIMNLLPKWCLLRYTKLLSPERI